MMAAVAHDLRHPLFRIALAVDLADEVDNDPMVRARSLEAIRKGLASMSRLVEDLDDFGSLQAGRLRLIRQPIDPTAIVESALASFRLLAATKKVALSSQISGELPEINADRDRLFQVVSNLLANAICATPPGGIVSVAVECDGEHARFVVVDSGPGVNPADLPHLFDRYWRGPNGGCSGRGLGLAIARDLVEGHGGQIWAENQSSGGARISFTVRRG